MERTDENILVKELTFPVPWGVIAAKAWGDPCLSPVLCVHGIQDNAGSFDRLIPMLPRSFYFVALDLPGHGYSSRLPKGVRLDLIQYVTSIYRVVLQLKWTQFCYMGHSLGGQLGTYYAGMYPEHITKLIVLDAISPAPLIMDNIIDFHKDMTDNLIKLESKILDKSPPSYTYESALDRLITNRPAPISRDAAEALVKRSLKKGQDGYYYALDQRLKLHVRTPITLEQHLFIMSKVKCPHLYVATEILSKFVKRSNPKTDRRELDKKTVHIFKKNPRFKMVLVDGFHDVHNSEPEKVAPHVSKFLLHQKSSL